MKIKRKYSMLISVVLTILLVASIFYSVHLRFNDIDATNMRIFVDNYEFFIAKFILTVLTYLSIWKLIK